MRDGDTIEVEGVAVRLRSLDCAESGTLKGNQATLEMDRIVLGEMLLTSVLILALGGALATRVFAQFQRLPGVLLVPSILILMCVGVYVINGRPVDLWIMLISGIAGYFLEKVNVPLAPIILGMILGPMAEQSVRRALLISRGDATELLTRPISALLAIATALVILWPIYKAVRRRGSVQKSAN